MNPSNKAKLIHPNKLVVQHEASIVNKALANKIRNVKCTIQNGNKQIKTSIKKRELYIYYQYQTNQFLI